MNLDLLGLFLWILAGVIALSKERVTKAEYAVCWVVAIINIICNIT